jgi:hypothetical protein
VAQKKQRSLEGAERELRGNAVFGDLLSNLGKEDEDVG